MSLRYFWLALWAASTVLAQETFVTERGNYRYTIEDITARLADKNLSYVTLRPERAIPGARYKLNKRGEFQIKDWFQRDWFEMQDMFVLDQAAYLARFQGPTFNEAKRNAYSKLPFSKKKFLHDKLAPLPREWGGLNHPPIKELTHPLSFYSANHATQVSEHGQYFSADFQRSVDAVSNSELSFGNQLNILEDQHAFQGKLKMIEEARETILMSSLVFVCDKGTQQITDLLIKKHQQGLDVRILVDGTISRWLKHRDCFLKMRTAGIQVIEADDFKNYKGRTIYHTKTLITDFKTAMAGGHNMIDADNLSRGVDFKNRDIDLQVTGPMVTDMAIAFLSDWQHFLEKRERAGIIDVKAYQAQMYDRKRQEKAQGLRGSEHYERVLNSEQRLNGVCRFVQQAPYRDGQAIGKTYLKLLDGVKNYLAITNPVSVDSKVTALNRFQLLPIEYFDSFEMYNQLHDKLQAMAKSGLRIDYLTTNIDMAGNENVAIYNEVISEAQAENRDMTSNWNLLKIYFSNRYYGAPHYKNLLKDWYPHKNVQIWNHISFLHSKVFHFDRLIASIGSYNLQHNATDHAYEITSICQDRSLNQQLDRVLVQDMANSIPLIFSRVLLLR